MLVRFFGSSVRIWSENHFVNFPSTNLEKDYFQRHPIFCFPLLRSFLLSRSFLSLSSHSSLTFPLLFFSSFSLIFPPSSFTLFFLGSPSFFLSFRFLALFHSLFSFSFHLSLSSSLSFVLLFVFNNEVNRTHRATVCINLYPALSSAVCRRVHFVYVRYMETVEGNIVRGDKKFSGETYWYRLDAISWNGRSFL